MESNAALAEQVVDAVADIFGSHAGCRAVHAKGVLLQGSFTATPEAASLTRAAHMQGDPVRATVRFSNAGGNPGEPDYAQDGRGMAVKLYLADGSRTDMVATNLPAFLFRNPQDFLEFTRLRRPDPATGEPDMEKIGAFLGEHPEALPGIQATLSSAPPASYAQLRYNGIHAFRYVNGDGEGRFGRFMWEPSAGEATLTEDEAKQGGADYLRDEILQRAAAGEAAFELVIRLAGEGDPLDDPTAIWPDDRERVTAGRLELTGPEPDREREGDVLVFDPTRVIDGIELSGDPILAFRPHAYAESVKRRSGLERPG